LVRKNGAKPARQKTRATRGVPVVEVFALLRTVLAMEGIAYRPK